MNRPAPHAPGRSRFLFVWGAPILLAAVSVVGLLAALLGTGAWHWASWACLAAPLLVILRYLCGQTPARPRDA